MKNSNKEKTSRRIYWGSDFKTWFKYFIRNVFIKNYRKIRYKCYHCCDTGWIWTDSSVFGYIPCDCERKNNKG